MLDTNFLKSLLSYDFFEQNKQKLSKQLFEEEIRDLYQTISKAHEKYEHDLSSDELLSLWKLENPVATKAERYEMQDLVSDIEQASAISQDIAAESIETLWRRHLGKNVASHGLEMAEGNLDSWRQLMELVERNADGYLPDDLGEPTTLSIKEILEEEEDEGLLQFNLSTLGKKIPGITRRKFGIIFATPETGKTAFVLSLAIGPGGYVDQGYKVMIVGNEESTKDTVKRAYGTALGYTKEKVAEDRDSADLIFRAKMDGNLIIYDAQDWDIENLEGALAKHKPAVVFIDQLDKVGIKGSYNATHERLGEIYRRARESAKRHNCLIWGVSQASNDATGKTRVTYDMMAGSKISKAAEADIIIGLGKHSGGSDDAEEDPTRFITVSKNKINGWHNTIICNLHGEVSRYVE
jgi:replicative DNA helicase